MKGPDDLEAARLLSRCGVFMRREELRRAGLSHSQRALIAAGFLASEQERPRPISTLKQAGPQMRGETQRPGLRLVWSRD